MNAQECIHCGRRVVWRDVLGGQMLCDVTIIVVDYERRDWGTSGPHFCSNVQSDETKPAEVPAMGA